MAALVSTLSLRSIITKSEKSWKSIENGFVLGAEVNSTDHNESLCLQFNLENVIKLDSGTCKGAQREEKVCVREERLCDGGGELPGNWCVSERDSIIGNDSWVSALVSAYTASLVRALPFPRGCVHALTRTYAPISSSTYMYHVTLRLPGNCFLPCQYEP